MYESRICEMVERSCAEAKDKVVSRLVDIQLAAKRILDGTIPSFILDDQILVCYEIGAPWYTEKLLVNELMVIRLKDGTTTLADVAQLFDDMVHMANAEGTAVGGALSSRPRALARRYKQLGYSEEDTPILIKWRDDG